MDPNFILWLGLVISFVGFFILTQAVFEHQPKHRLLLNGLKGVGIACMLFGSYLVFVQ